MGLNYCQAGVDIGAAERVLARLRPHLRRSATPALLPSVGNFASLFDLGEALKGYRQPLLVQSMDGVGSKTEVAALAGDYRHLGRDLFAAVCNDTAVMGAKPITFLDYVAQSRLNAGAIEQTIAGLADCCQQEGVALVGGETAEMPGVYRHDEALELVGVASAVLEREALIDGAAICAGLRLYGFASSGLHTNGYSLVRKLFFEQERVSFDHVYADLGRPLAEVLLAPHCNYLPLIRDLLATVDVKGLAHITGGGIGGNLPRILPAGLGVLLHSWPTPPLFELIASLGRVASDEMLRTFNMGVGLVLVAAETERPRVEQLAEQHGLSLHSLGEVLPLADNGGEVLRWQK